MLTILLSTISNSQVFLLKKKVSSFCKCKGYSQFFSKNVSGYAIFKDQSFTDMLINDVVSFEQLGPEVFIADTCRCRIILNFRRCYHLDTQSNT